MPIPLLVWGLVAGVGAVAGGFATAAATDTVEDVADAADSVNRLLVTTALVGGAFFLITRGDKITKALGVGSG